jgi:hypothetical protein
MSEALALLLENQLFMLQWMKRSMILHDPEVKRYQDQIEKTLAYLIEHRSG